jgi:cobyrinic acid a,c-diamide synthase
MVDINQTRAVTVLVAAVSSGQGKTTVTAALAKRLTREGRRVTVFKCGPDFIDPMLLERASGVPVHTLDLWMVGEEECRRRLYNASLEADVVLVEGVMGLYDGTPSAADLARLFKLPVLAVIDASSMAQTAGALVMGLRDYGPVELAGVIANRVASPRHREMVAASLTNIPGAPVPLIATLARQRQSLPERHLGLVLPGEVGDIDALLDILADEISFDADAWNAIRRADVTAVAASPALTQPLAGTTIAVARDAAFTFIYPANLDLLKALGAELTFFSPLADEVVPFDADAVYLPGGYPELHAATLSSAQNWQASIRARQQDGTPIFAECGGMMALADTLSDQAGTTHAMAGVLAGSVAMHARLAGLGPQAFSTPQGALRGHTFHYSTLQTPLAPLAATIKHPSGAAGEAVYRSGGLTASYFHAYFPSNPAAAAALFQRTPGSMQA